MECVISRQEGGQAAAAAAATQTTIFSKSEDLFGFLKYDIGLSAAQIVELADNSKLVLGAGAGGGSKDNNTTATCIELKEGTKQEAFEKDIVLMMSGRVRERDHIISFWRSHPLFPRMDIVMFLWQEHAHELPREVFPECVARDDRQSNSTLLQSKVLNAPEIKAYILVAFNTRGPIDDVSRINSQLCGLAWVYALAVLHQRFRQQKYKYFIRTRLDYTVPYFPFPFPAPLEQKEGEEEEEQQQQYKEKGWIAAAYFRPYYCPDFINDCFYYGDEMGMRICLHMYEERNALMRHFTIPPQSLPAVAELVRAHWFCVSSSNKHHIVLQDHSHEQLKKRHPLPPWCHKEYNRLRYKWITPENYIQVAANWHGIKIHFFEKLTFAKPGSGQEFHIVRSEL